MARQPFDYKYREFVRTESLVEARQLFTHLKIALLRPWGQLAPATVKLTLLPAVAKTLQQLLEDLVHQHWHPRSPAMSSSNRGLLLLHRPLDVSPRLAKPCLP